MILRLATACLLLAALTALAACADPLPAPGAPVLGAVPSPTALSRHVLRGTKPASTAILLERASGATEELVPLDGETTWRAAIDLVVGANAFGLYAVDATGQRSTRVPLAVLLDTTPPLPPVLDPVPARTRLQTVTVTGTVAPGDRAIANGAVLPGAGPGFELEVPIVDGVGRARIAALDLAGNESEVIRLEIVADETVPLLTVDTPSSPDNDALVGSIFSVSGTATDDDPALRVEVCVGLCTNDDDWTELSLTAGAFADVLDLSGRDDLLDGAIVDVRVRATDEAGNRAEETVLVLLFRAAVDVGGPAGALAVDLAGAATASSLAWLDATGTVGVSIDPAGGGFTPASFTLATGALLAGGVAIAASIGEAAAPHVVWLEDSARATSTPGQAGLVHARGEAGAIADIVARGDTDAVREMDVALLPSGQPVVAFIQGDGVFVAARGATGFSAPVEASDSGTAAPAGLALAVVGNTIALAWSEDAGGGRALVARRVDEGGPLGSVRAVSAAATASTAAAPLAGGSDQVALAWIQAGTAMLAVLDDAFFSGAAPTLRVASGIPGAGIASAVTLASEGDEVLIGWLDDGPELRGAAPAPVVVLRRGAPEALGGALVLASAAASSPSLSLAGGVARVAWLEAGTLRFFAVELP
jgi:hypothetical protein